MTLARVAAGFLLFLSREGSSLAKLEFSRL
jgi:hypothetical protein